MAKRKDGVEYKAYGETIVDWNGESFMKCSSCFNDIETGKALDCYYRADENGDEHYLIHNLDGSWDFS